MATDAELAILISAKDQASAVLRALSGQLDATALSSAGLVEAFGALSIAAAAAAVAISGTAVALAAGFEKTTVDLQNQANLSASATKEISDALLNMARDSEFSAGQLVGALAPVAGRIESVTGQALTAAQSLQVMHAAADLAEASNTNLRDATASLVDVMLAYHIPLSQAAQASDELFNITRVTGIGLSELTTAIDRLKDRLGNSAPDLSQMGALLSELSAQGISGSRGLLAVSSAVEHLTGGSAAVNKTLHDLGAGVFDAEGNFIGLRAVIAELQPIFANMTVQQQNAAAAALFGAGAAGTLINVIQAGTGAFDSYAGRVRETGTSAKGAAADNATLAVQLRVMRNDVEALMIAFGQKLLPVIEAVVNKIVPLLDAITNSHEAMTALGIVAAGVLVAGLAAAAVAFYSLAGAAIVAFAAENLALLGIPLAVTAAIAAIYLLVQNWDAVWHAMKAAPGALLDYFQNHWQKVIIDVILGPIGIIATNWKAIFDHMPEPVQTAMNAVAGIVSRVTNFIIDALNKVIDVINSIGSISLPDWLGGASIGINIPHIPGVGDFQLQGDQGRRGPLDQSMGGAGSGARGNLGGGAVVPSGGGGAGPYVVPPLTGGGGGGAGAAIPQAVLDLRALADAFAAWHAQTGLGIEDFQAYLKVGQDNLNLTKRQADAAVALKVQQMELNDAGYQLRLGLVAIAEQMAKTGQTINQFIHDTAATALKGFQDAFNAIFNRPSRETAGLQLSLDQLEQQRLILLRSHDTNDPAVKALDAQISALQNEIQIRQKSIDIMKDQALLADKTLQSDQDQVNQAKLLTVAISTTSQTVLAFQGAAFFDALAHINLANAVNETAAKIRSVSFSAPSSVAGTAPRTATSGQTASAGGATTAVHIEQHFTVDSSMSDAAKRELVQQVKEAVTGALVYARVGGSQPPVGAFA